MGFFLKTYIKISRASSVLRWRVIWMKEILGYRVDEVGAALRMLWRSESKYHQKTVKQCSCAPARGVFLLWKGCLNSSKRHCHKLRSMCILKRDQILR